MLSLESLPPLLVAVTSYKENAYQANQQSLVRNAINDITSYRATTDVTSNVIARRQNINGNLREWFEADTVLPALRVNDATRVEARLFHVIQEGLVTGSLLVIGRLKLALTIRYSAVEMFFPTNFKRPVAPALGS